MVELKLIEPSLASASTVTASFKTVGPVTVTLPPVKLPISSRLTFAAPSRVTVLNPPAALAPAIFPSTVTVPEEDPLLTEIVIFSSEELSSTRYYCHLNFRTRSSS